MILLLPVIVVLAVLVGFGFVGSRKTRHVDWRNFAAFIGFSSDLVAVAATFLWAVAAALPSYASIPRREFTFVVGLIGILSALMAFLAGLVSRGVQRLKLVGFGVVIGFVYLFGMFTHFGD